MDTIQHLIMPGGFYASNSMSDAFITAHIANDTLVSMADAAIVAAEAQLASAHAAYEAKKDEQIAEVIATKKTFWTRRTRTRDEAESYLRNKHSWCWLLTEQQNIRSAENDLHRLKEIRAIAAEPAFENITLTERDLRMVGGHAE